MLSLFRHPLSLLYSLALLLVVTSCDELISEYQPLNSEEPTQEDQIQLTHFALRDRGSQYRFDVGLPYIDEWAIDDSTHVRLHLFESESDPLVPHTVQPTLYSIENLGSAFVDSVGLKLLILVDLAQPQTQVDAMRRAVLAFNSLFRGEHLNVAFIHPDSVTQVMQATPYVLANYFVEDNAHSGRLYRSIIKSLQEWNQVEGKNRAMVVFSDGDVYSEKDIPLDPDHSILQQQLILLSQSLTYPFYYVNFNKEGIQRKESDMMFRSVAQRSGGAFFDSFDSRQLLEALADYYNLPDEQYRITMLNDPRRVYFGNNYYINLECYDRNDSLLMKGQLPYHLGNRYHLHQVQEPHRIITIFTALLLLLLLLLLAYLILQFIEPRIRDILFRRRYVTHYQHQGMSYRGILIQESCYYCKAPFQPGDLIVAHCPHVVHRECWDEAGGHCPEHGHNCYAGSHHYNTHNLFDHTNASFYAAWVNYALVAGFLAWLTFYLIDIDFSSSAKISSRIVHVPMFGFCVGFWFTAVLGQLTIRDSMETLRNVGFILLRALVVGVAGWCFFLLGGMASVYVLHTDGNSIFIDVIPWLLTGFLIALGITWRTRVHIRYKYVAIAILVSLAYFYLGIYPVAATSISPHVLQMFCFLVFALALSLSLAIKAPRSSHYFLHVSGAIKDMDIAVYKIFQNAPRKEMTIGKSVECDLQLSWDMTSTLAPVMARFVVQHGRPMLCVDEPGIIFRGKSLPVGHKIHLYHGRSFEIGKTRFTYVEKDF